MPITATNPEWLYAPWLSWLERVTVKLPSQGREFEPLWGRKLFSFSLRAPAVPERASKRRGIGETVLFADLGKHVYTR